MHYPYLPIPRHVACKCSGLYVVSDNSEPRSPRFVRRLHSERFADRLQAPEPAPVSLALRATPTTLPPSPATLTPRNDCNDDAGIVTMMTMTTTMITTLRLLNFSIVSSMRVKVCTCLYYFVLTNHLPISAAAFLAMNKIRAVLAVSIGRNLATGPLCWSTGPPFKGRDER